jgi:hypothetical protein
MQTSMYNTLYVEVIFKVFKKMKILFNLFYFICLINVHAINVDNFFESLRKNAAISQSFITKSFAKQYIIADAFFNSRIAISKQLLHHLTYSTNMNKIISKTTSSTNIITTIINSQHLSTINMS